MKLKPAKINIPSQIKPLIIKNEKPPIIKYLLVLFFKINLFILFNILTFNYL